MLTVDVDIPIKLLRQIIRIRLIVRVGTHLKTHKMSAQPYFSILFEILSAEKNEVLNYCLVAVTYWR